MLFRLLPRRHAGHLPDQAESAAPRALPGLFAPSLRFRAVGALSTIVSTSTSKPFAASFASAMPGRFELL